MNENETSENEQRLPILATHVKHLGPKVTEIGYLQQNGDDGLVRVPREAVEVINLNDERTLCVISEMKSMGGVFRPAFVFKGVRTPMAPTAGDSLGIDMIDMVEQGAAISNIKKYLETNKEPEAPVEKKIEWVEDTKGVIGVSDLEVTKHTTVIQDGDEQVEMPEWIDDTPAWDGALIAGGRVKKTAPWDFSPAFLPNHVVVDGQAVRVNKKDGSANSWSVLNPLLASEKRPAGALLGSVSDRYYTLGHPVWVKPMLKYAEMSGIKAAVTSWNEGAKCRVDLDVTQATQLRKSAAERLKERGDGKFLDTDSLSEASQSLDGLYKFGFTVNNSLDGRGSFGAYGSALRTYCQNLAVAGGIKTAITMRHTKGVMKDVDWDEFGLNLVNATAELNEWLVNTELMSWIPMDLQLMDQLLFVMEKEGLMTPPRLVKNKETGLITQVNRSHMDLAVTQGWKQPTLSYVSVQGEQKNTLYHALQCFTGAITHKPTVIDDKRELKGSTLGFDTMDNRLAKIGKVFEDIAFNTLTDAKNQLEKSSLSLSDKDDVMGLIADQNNIQHSDYGVLGDVPQYSQAHEIMVL